MSLFQPKVSVGVPVYNSERFLPEALDSLLAQTFEDFEIIISDNASTDGTDEICRSYASKDQRIRYIRNRMNYGLVYNFGQVFRLSSGQYFKWAAADDVCAEHYLRLAVEALDSDPTVVLAWGGTQGIDEHGGWVDRPHELSDLNSSMSVYSPDPVVRWRRLMRNIWWVDGPFYGVIRSDVLAKVPVLRKHISSDHFLLADLVLHGRFYEIPEVLFFNRVHTGKTSRVSTPKERAVLVDTDLVRKRRFARLKVVRLYGARPLNYLAAINKAPVSARQKIACGAEVVYAGLRWMRRPGRGGY